MSDETQSPGVLSGFVEGFDINPSPTNQAPVSTHKPFGYLGPTAIRTVADVQRMAAHRVEEAARAVRHGIRIASGKPTMREAVAELSASVARRAMETGHPAAFIAVMRAAGLMYERDRGQVVTVAAADIGEMGEIVQLYRAAKARNPEIASGLSEPEDRRPNDEDAIE